MPKNMTLRLSDDQAAALEMLSQADGKPMSETVRDAIDEHIEARRNDANFQNRLKVILERNKVALDRLAK